VNFYLVRRLMLFLKDSQVVYCFKSAYISQCSLEKHINRKERTEGFPKTWENTLSFSLTNQEGCD
jgi:hypothetical protein